MIPSHASYELGYRLAMEAMGMEPMLLLGMRLGEGSGCPLAFEIVAAACAVLSDMATFDEAGIDDDYLEEIRVGDKFSVEDKR
jgi:nicotinate-nucleotide--dimethylbenzimidazole phosphoribosyltransferase